MSKTKETPKKIKHFQSRQKTSDKHLAELKAENLILRRKNEDLEMELALRKK